MACVDYHHHVEISLDDSLRDVKNVYLTLCKVGAYFCYYAHGVLAHDCNYAPVHVLICCANDKYINFAENFGNNMKTILFLGNIGMGEILIIALVVLLFFGGRKIPELMRGLGKGVRSFKEGMSEVENELKFDADAPKGSPSGKSRPSQIAAAKTENAAPQAETPQTTQETEDAGEGK